MEEFTLSFEDSIYHVEAETQKITKINCLSDGLWLKTQFIQWVKTFLIIQPPANPLPEWAQQDELSQLQFQRITQPIHRMMTY